MEDETPAGRILTSNPRMLAYLAGIAPDSPALDSARIAQVERQNAEQAERIKRVGDKVELVVAENERLRRELALLAGRKCSACRHWQGFRLAAFPMMQRCGRLGKVDPRDGAVGLGTGMMERDVPAEVFTGADFGCVHYEPAEPTESEPAK